MKILQNKKTRAIILSMVALVVITLIVSKLYYAEQNSANDPRVTEARELYEKYNLLVLHNNLDAVFSLLDSIEEIYSQYNYYRESFEVGVLYNNRAAAYLTMALSYDSIVSVNDSIIKDSLLNMAELNVQKSISIYENWLTKYGELDEDELAGHIKQDFFQDWEGLTDKEKDNIFNKRFEEMLSAQYETERRLSVSYTNLGIVYRYYERYQDAASSYEKAIDLWDRNLTAENNLNILLGRPMKKRNVIQKLFPPERKQN